MDLKTCGSFPRYFLLVSFLFVIGIGLVVPQTLVTYPGLVQSNLTQLQGRYDFVVTWVVPNMPKDYLRVFLPNAGVSLFLIMVPLYWAGIWWLRRDHLNRIVGLMRLTSGLLVVALGHNTFSWFFYFLQTLPFPVVFTMYYPHGWIEILAFLLAGTVSFQAIDTIREFMTHSADLPDFHPGEIPLIICRQVWRPFLVIAIMLGIAGVIECWITPSLVASALKNTLPG